MTLIKKILKEIINVLKSIYEVLYVYPKFKYEELYEIYEREGKWKQDEERC